MKIVLFANTEWYLYNFRLSLANGLRKAGHEVILLSPPGPYGEKLISLGFEWHALPMQRRSLNPLREFTLLLKLSSFLKSRRVDLVHGFTIKCAVYGSIAGAMAGVQGRVSSVAGLGFVFISDSVKARLLRPLVRFLLRLALNSQNSRLILQNQDDVQLFIESGLIEAERIRLIRGSGVDCQKFVPPTTPRPFQAGIVFVLPARILWDKGVAEYVEAAKKLKAQYPTCRFLLAGAPDPGNPASVSQTIIDSWIQEGDLEVLGHVHDMVSLFQKCHVAVLPSYREGLPKGLIEAGACECALITTDVPGCREVVIHGKDGLLAKARDSQSLYQEMKILIDDHELLAKLGVAARAKAIREFEQTIVVQETEAVYSEFSNRP
jgi:glycosyltransferase involved in cell wall biosynthesis